MKRKYVIAVLTLLGLGVVSTLAFSLGSVTDSSVAGPVSITQSGTAENIDEVHVYPYQSPDGMYIIITLDSSITTSYVFDVSVEDGSGAIDLSAGNYKYKQTAGWGSETAISTTWDADLGAFTITTASLTGTTVKVRIYDVTDIYTDAETLLIFEQSLS